MSKKLLLGMEILSFALFVSSILLHLYFLNEFSDVCIMNSGISFGIGANILNKSLDWLIVINLTIFIGIGYLAIRNFFEKNILNTYLYITLFIVGVANFVERVRFGAICDYFSIFKLHFNIPDVIIVTVSALLIVQIFYKNYKNER